MKNKMVRGLVVAGMVSMMLTACGSKEQADVVQSTDMPVVQETATNTSITEEETPKAEAVTLTEEDMVVVPIDDTTAMLQSYSGEAESIIIPEEINGRKITVIGKQAFLNHEELKKIIIPDTVIEIRNEVFMNCDNLDYVIMSNNVERIDTYAFAGPNYYEINLPDSLKELGEGVFSGCEFTELVIPQGLETTGVFAFSNTNIEKLTVPSTIKIIELDSFSGCKLLKSVTIEEGVEVIEKGAFRDCEMLETISIPASVTEITNPFRGSDNVTIYTPAGSYAETWAAENGVPCVAQ